jgi:hypothetical protein
MRTARLKPDIETGKSHLFGLAPWRHCRRHFVGDALGGALHHQPQQYDMGLTIHYQLATTGDAAHARRVIQKLHLVALDLPFQRVGEIVEF